MFWHEYNNSSYTGTHCTVWLWRTSPHPSCLIQTLFARICHSLKKVVIISILQVESVTITHYDTHIVWLSCCPLTSSFFAIQDKLQVKCRTLFNEMISKWNNRELSPIFIPEMRHLTSFPDVLTSESETKVPFPFYPVSSSLTQEHEEMRLTSLSSCFERRHWSTLQAFTNVDVSFRKMKLHQRRLRKLISENVFLFKETSRNLLKSSLKTTVSFLLSLVLSPRVKFCSLVSSLCIIGFSCNTLTVSRQSEINCNSVNRITVVLFSRLLNFSRLWAMNTEIPFLLISFHSLLTLILSMV